MTNACGVADLRAQPIEVMRRHGMSLGVPWLPVVLYALALIVSAMVGLAMAFYMP
jgi:hypothetical protein